MTSMPSRGFFKRIGARLRYEAKEASLLGTGTLKRRFCRLMGKSECAINLAGVGPITVRVRDTDLTSFLGIFAGVEYDFPIPVVEAAVRARYDEILSAGRKPIIVDAGAYVGASVLWFGSKFPAAHIVAIEPDPDSFRLLRRNLGNRVGVSAVNAAVGASPGQVRLLPSTGSWATQVERSGTGIAVTTMNEAFAMVPEGEPLFAKVNIEGFEEDVFSANLEWLDRISLLYIEPHDWMLPGKRTSRSFQKAMGERDFHLFIVGPHLCYARL
jgi:FkbM family methyltransferase